MTFARNLKRQDVFSAFSSIRQARSTPPSPIKVLLFPVLRDTLLTDHAPDEPEHGPDALLATHVQRELVLERDRRVQLRERRRREHLARLRALRREQDLPAEEAGELGGACVRVRLDGGADVCVDLFPVEVICVLDAMGDP
jgi:hypothetical protein